jgi:hypothetical protein
LLRVPSAHAVVHINLMWIAIRAESPLILLHHFVMLLRKF